MCSNSEAVYILYKLTKPHSSEHVHRWISSHQTKPPREEPDQQRLPQSTCGSVLQQDIVPLCLLLEVFQTGFKTLHSSQL